MKKNIYIVIFLCVSLFSNLPFTYGTEDEYEQDHEDNVVEHPGPTDVPVRIEVEEAVDVKTGSLEDDSEEEEIMQTTTYPVFDEPLSTTTTQSSALSPTTPLISTTSNAPFLPPHQRPVRSDLASMPPPKGHEILVGNLTIYESPVTNETIDDVMLISVHDIFGFHPHVKYIADRLSGYGFRSIVPDFFHGKPVEIDNFPPPSFAETAKYLFNKEGFWIQVKSDLLNTMNYYRHVANITSFGLYGFCWGGKMIVYSSADKDFKGINAIGLVHPSRVVTQDANEINAPALLLPSNAELDMVPFLQTLEQRFGEGKSEHYRYDDMRHGFAGATSDFSNPDVRRRVEDVIDKLSRFFRKHLV